MEKLSLIIVMMLIMTALAAQNKPAQNQPETSKIEFKDLPKNIAQQVSKGYAEFKVTNVFKVVRSPRNINYRIVIAKGEERHSLIYDNSGKLLRKIDMNAGTDKNAPNLKPKKN